MIVSLEADTDHVLLGACHVFVLLFVRCAAALAPPFTMRTVKPEFPIHSTVRIRPRPKNKPASFGAGQTRPRDIRVYRIGFSRPIVCSSAPDILHESYLVSEQSPASSHNTPVHIARALH
jgi:hypothetical protein